MKKDPLIFNVVKGDLPELKKEIKRIRKRLLTRNKIREE